MASYWIKIVMEEIFEIDEKKIAKNIRLIYKAKPYLNKNSLLALYFSCIYSYINYANLVWASTHRTYLRKINSQQKHALRLIHNKNRFCYSKELFESCEILNPYKLNLLNTAVFNRKIKNRTGPLSFLQNLSSLLFSHHENFCSLRIQNTFQVGITGDHKLNYANANFEFLLEVQQYATTWSEVRKKKLNHLLYLKIR